MAAKQLTEQVVILSYPSPYDNILTGQIIKLYNSIWGVVISDASYRGDEILVAINGRFLVDKDTLSSSFSIGDKVYYDPIVEKAISLNNGNLLGVAISPAQTTDDKVDVYLTR